MEVISELTGAAFMKWWKQVPDRSVSKKRLEKGSKDNSLMAFAVNGNKEMGDNCQ